MKIPEKELRKIIRAQILSERFDVELIPAARIEQCDIDIPTEYNLNQLALAASDAMNLYGIPGSFCDIINSLMPEPKKGSRGSSGSGDESSGGDEPATRIDLLESLKKDLTGTSVLFLPNVNPRTPTPTQVANAQDYFEVKYAFLEEQEITQTIAKDAAREILTNVFKSMGDIRDVDSKLDKVTSRGESANIASLVSEAKFIMKQQAKLELTKLRASSNLTSAAKNAIEAYLTEIDRLN